VAFSARITDDPGDRSTVRWVFDDGSTATGASVRKAFATPGPHRATATATDTTGLRGTAATTITVAAPPAPPAPAAASGDSAGGALTPPARPTLKRSSITFGKLGALRLRRGRVAVPVRCDGACSAVLTLRTKGRRPAVLGKASFRLTRAGARTVAVKLSKSGLRRLRRARTTSIVVVVQSGKAAKLQRAARVRG
jgi:hypothetical protein